MHRHVASEGGHHPAAGPGAGAQTDRRCSFCCPGKEHGPQLRARAHPSREGSRGTLHPHIPTGLQQDSPHRQPQPGGDMGWMRPSPELMAELGSLPAPCWPRAEPRTDGSALPRMSSTKATKGWDKAGSSLGTGSCRALSSPGGFAGSDTENPNEPVRTGEPGHQRTLGSGVSACGGRCLPKCAHPGVSQSCIRQRHQGSGEGQGISAPVSQRARKATKQGPPRQTPTGHSPGSSSVKIRGSHRSR